jgi:hypothetical protein
MFYGGMTARRRTLRDMIPLHLRSNTIHVSREEADRLVASGAAEWLPGNVGLVAKVDDALGSLAA